MGLARRYNRILKRELKCHAAWIPFTDRYRVGDYGVLDQGIFRRLGNISELGVVFGTQTGDGRGPFAFKNASVREVKLGGAGDLGRGRAEFKLHFKRKKRVFVAGGGLKVEQMASVALAAKEIRKLAGWRHLKYVLVDKVYYATDAVVVASRTGNTDVTISGSVDAIKAFKAGEVSASLSLSSSSELSLEIFGKQGPIGLGLVRVRQRGQVVVMSSSAGSVGEPDAGLASSSGVESDAGFERVGLDDPDSLLDF